jgi:hypothetical protein
MKNYLIGQNIPSTLLNLTFKCDVCHRQFKPDWLKPLGFPLGPYPTSSENIFLQRVTTTINCTVCMSETVIEMPRGNLNYVVKFYGDEAERVLDKGSLFTYSVVGISPKWLEELESDIKNLKRDLSPNLVPEEWSIHMKKLWNGSTRNTHPEYEGWSKKTVDKFLMEISKIISKYGNRLFKYNILFYSNTVSSKSKYLRDEAYITLITVIISELAKRDTSPHFHFDSIKNSTSSHTVHAWAKKAFENGCENLMYGFISRGIPVPEPVFVSPGSNSMLELADILSFSVARYNFNRIAKKPQDIDLKMFGEVCYMGLSSDSRRIEFYTTVGYPTKFTLKA